MKVKTNKIDVQVLYCFTTNLLKFSLNTHYVQLITVKKSIYLHIFVPHF